MERKLAAMAIAGLFMAQLSTPGYVNLGVPAVPGTRMPESNPATAAPMPQSSVPSSLSAPTTSAGPAALPGSSAGPAYSFGAAPSPVVAPGR
jgi:hypothetical protein